MRVNYSIGKRALRAAAVAIFSAAIFASGPVSAAAVTFIAEAVVFRVENPDGLLNNFFADVPEVDDTVIIVLTFDPEALGPAALPFIGQGVTDVVGYQGGVPFASITVRNQELISTGGPGQESILVTTIDDGEFVPPGIQDLIGFYDGYGFTAGAPGDGGNRWGLNLAFAGGMLDSLDPPTDIPNLNDFDGAGVGFRSFNEDEQFNSFSALIVDVQPIPLPAGAWLLASALAAAGWLRRRNSR